MVTLSFEFGDKILWRNHSSTNYSYCIGYYFPVVLLIIPYKVVLTFESMDVILKCDDSGESY